MTKSNITNPTPENFKADFLKHYMSVGIGALSKKDIDALVMHLIDKYGYDGMPLKHYSNQEVSAILKAPSSKIKQLRYEAGLKYGGSVEIQAKAKLLTALSRAAFDIESKKICLIVEDNLAKNWLQGQLKNNGLIFDHSFNTEIIKVDSKGLFSVLTQFFDKDQTEEFRDAFEYLATKQQGEALRKGFSKLAIGFATEAAKKLGVVGLTAIGVPIA